MTGIILLVLRIAMTAALYALLAWAFWLMWRTLRQETLFLSRRKVAPLTLKLHDPSTSSGQRPLVDPGQLFHFTNSDVVIGRHADCECVLDDETISSRHVRLAYHHNQWWAEDMGSRNGTILNNAALTTPTILIHGDTVRCGNTTLMVILIEEESPTEYDTLSDTEIIL
jgi:pSer/pThr/pTyr-binding forkhead associated (FHA) protein